MFLELCQKLHLSLSFNHHNNPVGVMVDCRIVPSHSLPFPVRQWYFPAPLTGGLGVRLPLGHLKVTESDAQTIQADTSRAIPWFLHLFFLCHETNTCQKGRFLLPVERKQGAELYLTWKVPSMQARNGPLLLWAIQSLTMSVTTV